MAAPSFGGVMDSFWLLMCIIIGVAAGVLFGVYRYYIEPPIARQFTAAKWKKGTPAFIQDNAGVVHFTMSDKELPEGVIHNKKGWFLLSRAPYIPDETEEEKKRGPGRPPKAENTESKQEDKLTDEQIEGLKTVLQVPVLAGFGKAVFFGYDGAPLLSNLKTLVHADLRVMKEIIPATISRTQIANLHRWSLAKGYEKRGGDTMKLIYVAIAAAVPIACLGIVAFLLLNKGA